jgi:hypothetical protein
MYQQALAHCTAVIRLSMSLPHGTVKSQEIRARFHRHPRLPLRPQLIIMLDKHVCMLHTENMDNWSNITAEDTLRQLGKFDVKESMLEDMRRLLKIGPVTRNFYRCHGRYKEADWQYFWARFNDFVRAAQERR